MKFHQVYPYLKNRGYKAKLPEWGGYWLWDSSIDSILLVTRHGDVIDIRETEDVDYTFQFIIYRDDWEIYK